MKHALWIAPFVVWMIAFNILLNAGVEEEEVDRSIHSSVQEVEGLLFDVDEGVKIEKGPGGSIYLESNREYMQKKFQSIEDRFRDLERRLEKLEKFHDAELLDEKLTVPELAAAKKRVLAS